MSNILRDYFVEYLSNPFKKESYITNLIPKTIKTVLAESDTKYFYIIKGSNGYLKPAEIPWVAIMNTGVTASAKEGLYTVYLFSHKTKSIFLGLAFGWLQYLKKYGSFDKAAYHLDLDITALDLNNHSSLQNRGFSFKGLDLRASTDLAKGYENSCFYYKQYAQNTLQKATGDNLKSDLSYLVNLYEDIIAGSKNGQENV